MPPLLRDLPPDERERLTSVIWAPQNPRSPTCDYCGEFRPLLRYLRVRATLERCDPRFDLGQCRCEARRAASHRRRRDGTPYRYCG